MSKYRTLTPKFRAEIAADIARQMAELNTCEQNVLVNTQKSALKALSSLIDMLPDGYLVPIEEGER